MTTTGSVDPSLQQQDQSRYQSEHDYFTSFLDELAEIDKERKIHENGSKKFNDCIARSQAVYQRLQTAWCCREIVAIRRELVASRRELVAEFKKLSTRLNFITGKPWHDPAVVQRCDTIARQTAPKFNWMNNLTDLSQITWSNVKVFECFNDLQLKLCCSKNEQLIRKMANVFEEFKKKIDEYKPTFCQKIWQIITLRFTFIKVNLIREYLEDLDIPYMTKSITE